VLKAGEVLYIVSFLFSCWLPFLLVLTCLVLTHVAVYFLNKQPSHWFHYIISLQKSAQCNVRSGVDLEGSEEFGGHEDVVQCVD
jgi:hypothetical protein